MVYILPIRHENAADWLGSSIRGQGPKIAADLGERMAVVLEEGEEPPDVVHFMDVMARMVKHESDVLSAADMVRDVEGGELKYLLGERAKADAEVRAIVISIRDRMRGNYGAKRANMLLGIKGRTPRNTADLEIMADRMVCRLADAELPPVRGCEVDSSAWADELRPARQRLLDVIDEIWVRRGRMDAGVIAKGRALKASAKTYSRIVRLLELIYQLSGHDWLAKTLRRKLGGRPRRRGRNAVTWERRKRGEAVDVEQPGSAADRERPRTWLGTLSRPASRWFGRGRRPGGPRVA